MICQLVRMINTAFSTVTSIAYIVVRANFTTPTLTTFDIEVTCVTCCNKSRSSWIVQMIKHHHWGMFRPPQCIILIMVPLTKTQECLPRIKKFTFKYRISIRGVCRNIGDLNLQNTQKINNLMKIQRHMRLDERTSSQIPKLSDTSLQLCFFLVIGAVVNSTKNKQTKD